MTGANDSSALRPAQAEVALGAEHVAVEVGDPLPSTRGNVEIADGGLDMRGHAVPVELRIEVGKIGGRGITELLVHADFLELVIQRIGFAQIMRIAELADEIGG